MCKCGNIAAAPLFTHYYKQKTAEKQVIGGKSAVDKGKFFCGRPWSQIVELSTVFPFPSPARAEELPRSARRRADFNKLSRKPPKLSTKSNICTARCEGKNRSLRARPGGRKSPFAPLRAKKEDGFFRHRAKWLAGGGQTPQGASARFPFDPPQGKAWEAAGYMRECPALSSPFSRCGRKRRADGGRFCRFACPTPPHMV